MVAELPRGAAPVQGVVTAESPSFLGAWTRLLGALPPIDRLVLQHRTGMLGSLERIDTVAAMLGVSVERVRQIEARALGALASSHAEVAPVAARLTAAVPFAVTDLATLAGDPWWDGLAQGHPALELFVSRVAETPLRLVAFGDQRLLTDLPAERWHDLWMQWCAAMDRLRWPLPTDALRRALDALCEGQGEGVAEVLWTSTHARLHADTDPAGEPRALAYGDDDDARVLAILRGSVKPLAVSALHERLGHAVKVPREALWFDHGVVGVTAHVPEFETWAGAVAPAAVAVMQRGAAGSVWLVSEIHEELAREKMIPGWINAWLLGSMLQRHPLVRSLGRSKVALADPRRTARPPRM
jgi:hypothetical protein